MMLTIPILEVCITWSMCRLCRLCNMYGIVSRAAFRLVFFTLLFPVAHAPFSDGITPQCCPVIGSTAS